VDGDGCGANCMIERGYICTEVSLPTSSLPQTFFHPRHALPTLLQCFIQNMTGTSSCNELCGDGEGAGVSWPQLTRRPCFVVLCASWQES